MCTSTDHTDQLFSSVTARLVQIQANASNQCGSYEKGGVNLYSLQIIM